MKPASIFKSERNNFSLIKSLGWLFILLFAISIISALTAIDYNMFINPIFMLSIIFLLYFIYPLLKILNSDTVCFELFEDKINFYKESGRYEIFSMNQLESVNLLDPSIFRVKSVHTGRLLDFNLKNKINTFIFNDNPETFITTLKNLGFEEKKGNFLENILYRKRFFKKSRIN